MSSAVHHHFHSTERRNRSMKQAVTIYICSILLSAPAGGAQQMMSIIIENPERVEKGGGSRPVVTSRSKNPVNIPSSSRRFRPNIETNAFYDCYCEYWNGRIRLVFTAGQGDAKVLISGPDGERLYRYSSRQTRSFEIGDTPGDYKVTVKTSRGVDYEFEFTVRK